MDALQDFFKEAKNRISNPLIFSFIITWLFWNWRIPVGFLMYNSASLKNFGYNNYSDLIIQNATWSNYFWHPLLTAIIYTIAFAPIRIVIIAFLNKIKTIGDGWNKKILKNSTVPMARFIKETDKTDKLSLRLEELYAKDSDIKNENDELKKKLNESDNKAVLLENRIQEVTSEKNRISIEKSEISDSVIDLSEKLKSQFDLSMIQGTWQIAFTPDGNDQVESIRIVFNNRQVTLVNEILAFDWGEVLLFAYDTDKNKVYLTMNVYTVRQPVGQHYDKKIYFQELEVKESRLHESLIEMEGKDSDGNSVRYLSIPKPPQTEQHKVTLGNIAF